MFHVVNKFSIIFCLFVYLYIAFYLGDISLCSSLFPATSIRRYSYCRFYSLYNCFSFMYTLPMVTMLAVILLPNISIRNGREPGTTASYNSTAMGSLGWHMNFCCKVIVLCTLHGLTISEYRNGGNHCN